MPIVPASVRRRLARRALTIRSWLLRYPALRALFGLVVGFLTAAVTFIAVDRYGTEDTGTIVVVHEDLDYDGFCAAVREGGRAFRIADDVDGWRCGGFVEGLWSPVRLDFDALCAWQYGDSAAPRQVSPEGAFSTVCAAPN